MSNCTVESQESINAEKLSLPIQECSAPTATIQHGEDCNKMQLCDNLSMQFLRMDLGHSSLKSKTSRNSKRRLCRHHSDSSTNFVRKDIEIPRRHPSSRSSSRRKNRRVKRSVSAIESERPPCVRIKVRRSISERSNAVGKYLLPPSPQPGGRRSRTDSCGAEISDGHSSRCSKASSTRTAVSNASISEVMAVEMGLKDIPGLTYKEARRRRVACTVGSVTVILLLVSVLLVALTLLLSPAVDAILRKENEEIYRGMSPVPSTPAPAPDGVPGNDTTSTSNGQPG